MPKNHLGSSILSSLDQLTEMMIDPAPITEVSYLDPQYVEFVGDFIPPIQQIGWFVFRVARYGLYILLNI